MQGKRHIVVGIGEVLWDLLPEGRRLGGAPANFAYHSHALGADGIVVSAIGEDKEGQAICDQLAERGIATTYLTKTPQYPTGSVSVNLTQDGQASYTIHSPVAWDNIPWSDALASLAAKCDAVCFGSLAQRSNISRETIQRFLESTKQDCLRVFDINIRQDFATEEIVRQSLKRANVFKLNDEELEIIIKMLDISESDESGMISRIFADYDLNCVILTKGAAGSTIYTKDNVSFCKSQDVSVVDTVGAGDSFTAATVMGLLSLLPLERLHRRASDIADYVCTQPGATPPLNDRLTTGFD